MRILTTILTSSLLMSSMVSASELPLVDKALSKKLALSCFDLASTVEKPSDILSPPVEPSDDAFRIVAIYSASIPETISDFDPKDNYESQFSHFKAKPIRLAHDGLVVTMVIKTKFRWRTPNKGGWTQSENKLFYRYHECGFEQVSKNGSKILPVVITTYHNATDKPLPKFLVRTEYERDHGLSGDLYYSFQLAEYISDSPTEISSSLTRTDFLISSQFSLSHKPQSPSSSWDYGTQPVVGATAGW